MLRGLKYLLIVLFVLNISFREKEEKTFTFVQLCDTQLGMGGYQHDVKSFGQAVLQINKLNPDFVVICGDLVHHANDSSYTDFLKIKAGFTMPCYLTSGNHDVGNTPNDTSLRYYRKTIGDDYYKFIHKGHAFIVTNTQFWKVEVPGESEKHDRWVKRTLKKQNAKGRPAFVLGHYPLFTETFDEEEHYFNLPLKKRLELLALFENTGVRAYLSGHTHRLVVNKHKGIQLVSGETTSKNFDKRPMGFRSWEVSEDTIKHHFVALKLSNND